MKILDSYFEDEVREGYYIPSIMKKSWAADQKLLWVFQEICEKHGIQYYAEWGALLGAIRHGGTIPWDDDIDVCMKRSEYNKLMAVMDEFPEGYTVLDYRTGQGSDSVNMITKLANWGSYRLSPHLREEYYGYPYVAMIDIFILDYLPTDEKKEQEFREIIEYLNGLIGEVLKEKRGERVDWLSVEECLREIENFFEIRINRQKSIALQLYEVLMERVPDLVSEREAKELTHLPVWTVNANYRLPKSCFEGSMKVPFENMEICVPVGYDELLKRKYGADYMTPVQAGGSHDYPYFEKIENKLRERGEEIFEYTFSIDEWKKMEQEREEERQFKVESLGQRTRPFVTLFQEAHESLIQLLNQGELDNVVALMGECQEVAVQLGSMIEEERGEGSAVVVVLEQYCEQLFHINEELICCVEEQTELDIEHIYAELLTFEEKLVSSIEEELPDKKEIVFVPYKAKYWKTMQETWEKYTENPEYDVYVVPAPYYYKDNYGAAKMDEMQYETEGYPEEVSLVSYESYNFQTRHPDILVIQCPYDDYNYAMTIHPFFYARNLKKYTEKLVYIPALVMDEVGLEDQRMQKMLRYYCNMPGVVYADEVLVQSEQMKQVYVELLTEFAGEDTREIWDEKIVAVDFSLEDRKDMDFLVDIPIQWGEYIRKQDGQRKKVILYTTSVSALLSGGETMIEKMKNVLETFYENREEIALIWRSDRAVREVLRKDNPKLWRQYSQLVQGYREADWGIFDDSVDDMVARRLCDACYGDGGRTMNGCRVDGKPVMV